MANLDEELLDQQSEEEEGQQGINEEVDEDQRRQEALEVYNQQQRQQQQKSNPVADQAKKQAKKWLIRTTWPYWGTALAIIAGIALLLFVVIAVPVAVCNDGYFSSTGAVKLAFTSAGICDAFKGSNNTQTTITNTNSQFVDLPKQYWSTANFSVIIGDFPRVRSEVLTRFIAVFTSASAQGLNIRITSALRKAPEWNFSCHFLGEAIDVALPAGSSASDINKLVQMGRNAGFGFVLNEYVSPSEQANGPHVHMQLTAQSCAGRQAETPPTTEYYIP